MINKTILITGATSGVGKELATYFISKGHTVYCIGRDISKVNFPCESIDISNEVDVYNFIQTLDKIDILINNAAVYNRGEYNNIPDHLDDLIDINLKGSIYVTIHSIEKMDKGRIININSVAGLNGIKNEALYCASKAGLKGFMDSLSQELISKDILITNIHPGGINTELWNYNNPYNGNVNETLRPVDILNTVEYIMGLSNNVVVKDITLFPKNEWH